MMTMELSTSMPMPRASPPRESMFRVRPAKYMAMMVMMKDSGMEIPMMSVVGMLRRNRNRMATASRPPIRAVCQTLAMAWLMKLEEANSSTRLDVGGQRLPQLVQALLDPLGDLHRVGAGLLLDAQDDGRVAVQEHVRLVVHLAAVDRGDVLQADGPACLAAHHHPADLFRGAELAEGAQGVLAGPLDHRAAGHVQVLGPQQAHHLVDGQAVGGQAGPGSGPR